MALSQPFFFILFYFLRPVSSLSSQLLGFSNAGLPSVHVLFLFNNDGCHVMVLCFCFEGNDAGLCGNLFSSCV